MVGQRLRSQKGLATVEFAVIASVALIMAFVIVDFGSLIQAQAVVTNVTREGGSLASRDLKTGPDLMNLLTKSSSPLNFFENPERYKIFIAKVNAGESGNPNPTCPDDQEAQNSGIFNQSGQLLNPEVGPQIVSPTDEPNCGLTQELYDLLKYDTDISAAPVSQFTVVKVYWVHHLMTPLEGVMNSAGHSVVNFDFWDQLGQVGHDDIPDSILMSSKSVF